MESIWLLYLSWKLIEQVGKVLKGEIKEHRGHEKEGREAAVEVCWQLLKVRQKRLQEEALGVRGAAEIINRCNINFII